MALQANIDDVTAGLRRALKRRAFEPDSDLQITGLTNRGYKDLQGSHLTRLGQLAPPPGLGNEVVEYGGARREILNRKAPLVDDDGYALESDDDDEQIQQAAATAAQFDPYAHIRIDEILAPLTAITDLPTHPTLSRPFTSNILTQLADQSSAIMRKENQSLWKTKHLYTQLNGDFDWVPCGMVMAPGAALAVDGDARRLQAAALREQQKPNGHPPAAPPRPDAAKDEVMTDADAPEENAGGERVGDKTGGGGGGATTTTAAAPLENAIHALFQPPPNARPDRNIGIPEEEAEPLRKLLSLWVQKQEEVCRGIARLNSGLLRADRLRQEVLHWSKAEAHCGPNRDISDGEDWYDKERWGLVDDLKKGDDEAEEEEMPTAKKTRARR